MLGYASERQLCLALSAQTGWPGIVLDESVIRLDVLEYVSLDWARIFSALVVYEDAQTLVVAAARPEDAIVPARELAASRGKNVELRIALDVTLARTIRVAFTPVEDRRAVPGRARGRSLGSLPRGGPPRPRRRRAPARPARARRGGRAQHRARRRAAVRGVGRWRDLDRRLADLAVDQSPGSRRWPTRSGRWRSPRSSIAAATSPTPTAAGRARWSSIRIRPTGSRWCRSSSSSTTSARPRRPACRRCRCSAACTSTSCSPTSRPRSSTGCGCAARSSAAGGSASAA